MAHSPDSIPNYIPQVGDLIATRYRIEGTVGSGAMGAVFRARHCETERVVAVKVLWPNVLESQKVVEMFALEAKVAARVRSPHIVEILDAGFDEAAGLPFLVMELLSGQSFGEMQLPLTPKKVVHLLSQIARALDKAHSYRDQSGELRPIIHRDLKPDNLFLHEPEGQEPIAKVLDFGLAKVLGGSVAHSTDMKGTPLFMAPEQAEAKELTPQTDIWSLGLIAFYLLTGEHYWKSVRSERAQIATLILEIISQPLSPASERLRDFGVPLTLPPAFDAWLLCCLNREPKQRFERAGMAIDALSQVFDERSSASYVPPSSVDGFPSSATLQSSEPSAVQSAKPELNTLGPMSRTFGAAGTSRLRWGIPVAASLLIGGGVWAFSARQTQSVENTSALEGFSAAAGQSTGTATGSAQAAASVGVKSNAATAEAARRSKPALPMPGNSEPSAEALGASANVAGATGAAAALPGVTAPAVGTAGPGDDRVAGGSAASKTAARKAARAPRAKASHSAATSKRRAKAPSSAAPASKRPSKKSSNGLYDRYEKKAPRKASDLYDQHQR